MLLPLRMMWDRVELARDDADTTFFFHLLYAGELVTKLVTAGLLAAVMDDREGQRYRLTHKLIRTSSLGDWAQTLDEIVGGPPARHLTPRANEDQRSLTERFRSGTWQHEAVHLLFNVLRTIAVHVEPLGDRVSLRQWFASFVMLRNATRGHGATTPGICANVAPDLERSIKLIIDHLPLLQKPWAYLYRNLSGKYRVIALGADTSSFDQLKTTAGASLPQFRGLSDGIYIDFQQFVKVELVETSIDVADFFVANGGFKGTTFELLSLITDNRKQGDASPYMAPAGERPRSETEGRRSLDAVGETWTNAPKPSIDYVPRPPLEDELYRVLKDNRHPVITLVGSGGVGKTSLAISVTRRIAVEGLFEVIVWFSARDIDLMPEGPKVVSPRVLTQEDIAGQFERLMEPKEAKASGFRAIRYLAESLAHSPTGRPILFVFDNFETVRSPVDLFEWLDMHIRLPNKILITTRYREFKADYPIEVSGMTEPEADELIDATARRLGIFDLLTTPYRAELYEEADGHPYIIKVLLGEVAKARKLVKVERIVAGKDEILDALFERTYARLQPVARRVFLTLCSWRSLVPQLALEAVLLRPANEKMDVSAAVEELVQSSFVERTTADEGIAFLDVALVASVFGRRKLAITAMKPAIEADVELLQQIGATSSIGQGVRPRIERLFRSIAARISVGRLTLDDVIPSLEFICRQYTAAWSMLAKLHEEAGGAGRLTKAAECLQRLLEQPQPLSEQRTAWDELARIFRLMRDWTGAAQAQIRMCAMPDTPYSMLSNTANWLNSLFSDNYVAIDTDEKRLLYRELARLMEHRKQEADATDLSRLAWLYLHLHDAFRAEEVAEEGLTLDPDNEHCIRLLARLRR